MGADFMGGCIKEEGKDPGLFSYRMGYLITHYNYLIIWASRLQSEIALNTMEAENISLSQATRDVLPFVSLIK